jgi:hypothetical protein
MSHIDRQDQGKGGSSRRSPIKGKDQPVPDKDWYRKWQDGLRQREK